jgi:hypothetical protein
MQDEEPSFRDISKSRPRPFERPDEEIIEQLNRSHRAAWLVLLGLLVCFVPSAILVFIGRAGVLPLAVGEYFGAAALVVWFLAAFLWIGRRMAPPPEANEERILRKRIDSIQNLWRWFTVLFVCTAFTTTFTTTFSLSRALARAGSLHLIAALIVGVTFVFAILLYVLAIFYGPGYLSGRLRVANDELARALHARAFKAGYLMLMFMLGGVLLATLYRPALTIPALCWVLYAGFAIPTLYYVILQWRIGSGD